MSLLEENWKPVAGAPGYLVSDLGRVRATGGPLLAQGGRAGGATATLWVNGEALYCPVHRLVAAAFVPNPGKFPFVQHLDEDPLNNRAANLQWAPPKWVAQRTSQGLRYAALPAGLPARAGAPKPQN